MSDTHFCNKTVKAVCVRTSGFLVFACYRGSNAGYVLAWCNKYRLNSVRYRYCTNTSVTFKFRKTQRLRTPAEFKLVYNNKQWGNTRLLTYNVLPDPENGNRLGVTVSKKVSKLAVRRNLLKRLVREFFRQHQSELCNAMLVITVKPAAKCASNQQINEELAELWSKVLKWQRWNHHQQQQVKHAEPRKERV